MCKDYNKLSRGLCSEFFFPRTGFPSHIYIYIMWWFRRYALTYDMPLYIVDMMSSLRVLSSCIILLYLIYYIFICGLMWWKKCVQRAKIVEGSSAHQFGNYAEHLWVNDKCLTWERFLGEAITGIQLHVFDRGLKNLGHDWFTLQANF